MSQVGAHYSYTHDLSEGLKDLPGQDVAHEWGGAFMASSQRIMAGVTFGLGAFHISVHLEGSIDMFSYTFSDKSDMNGLTSRAIIEFAKSRLRRDKKTMKMLSSQAAGLVNTLRAIDSTAASELASREEIEDGLKEGLESIGPALIQIVYMAKKRIDQEIRTPLLKALTNGLKSPKAKTLKPRLRAGKTSKSLSKRFGDLLLASDEDRILKSFETRLRFLVTRLVYDIAHKISTTLFYGRDDLDIFAVFGDKPEGKARKKGSITKAINKFMECPKEPCEPHRCFKAPIWFQPEDKSKKRFGRLLCVLFQNDAESEFADILLQSKERELGQEDICRIDKALESSENCQKSDRSCVWAAKMKGIGKTCCHQHNVFRVRRPENKEEEVFACGVSVKSFNTYSSKRNGRIQSVQNNARDVRRF